MIDYHLDYLQLGQLNHKPCRPALCAKRQACPGREFRICSAGRS